MSTPTSSHGSGLPRPHSRAQPRPSSSSSHARPLSSLSTARPLSSASLRPQSRLSRPSSRISRPVTRHTARLLPLCQCLVTHITRLSPDNDPENYHIAVDFALKNLEHALKGGASTDMTTVDKRFRGHVQKARINNQDTLANALEKAYTRVKGHAKDLIDIDEEIKLSHLPDHLQLLLLLSAIPSRSTLAFADTYDDRDSPEKEPPLTWKGILAEEPLEGQHWEGVYGLPPGSTIEGWETKGTDSDSSLSTWDDLDSLGNDDGDEDIWNRPSEDPPSQGVHTPDTSQRTVPSHVPTYLTAVEELKAQQYWRDDWHIGVDVNRPFDLGDPSTLGPTMLRVRGEKEPLSLSGPEREKHIFERDAVREVLMCLQGRKNFLIYTTTDTFRSVPSPTAPRLLHFTLTAQSSILSALAEVTTTVCHLRKFAAAIVENVSSSYNLSPNPAHLLSHSIRSRTIEAFADAVNAQIQRFDSWCAAKEEAICLASVGVGEPLVVSLLSLSKDVRDTFAGTFDVLLNLLHRFVGYVSQSHDRRDLAVWKIPNMPTRIPPSAVSALLLDLLLEAVEEQAALGNTQTSDALISVLARTTEPTWEMVGKWLLDGMPSRRPWDSTDAPSLDEEFFIEDNELQIMDPDFWSDGYVLRVLVTLEENQKTQSAVPAFLEPAVIQILGAGKAVGLLREMGTRVFTEHSDRELLNLGTFRALIDTNSAVSKDSEALSRLISEEISAYCLTVAMRLSCVMTEECDLQRHLSAIHGLFLTTRGDDINTFTDILFAKMDAQKHWTDFHSLNSAFSDVVELNESNWIDASLVRLSYRGNKAASASQTVKAIDGLLVEYAVPFPLTYIFTPNVLQSYCSIFVFLLQIRRAKSVLEQILLRNSVANAALRSELKVFYAMRGKLSWFINTIFNFVTTFVIHSQLIKFWEAVNQAKSLDELITIHNDHLDMLLRECFLHSSTTEISKAIVSILDMCLHFRNMFTAYVGDTAHDILRLSVSLRRHKSRRQRRIRKNVIGFSQPGARFDSDDDSSDTDLDEEGLKEAPETSFSIAPSLAQEDPSEQLEKLSSELDSLVRYIRRCTENLSSGTSDAAQASGILAFTLDDWDS
ncbi:Spc98 family-domain-containing protein [Pisolithus orientalis]|uniref:Spc98 family-domain-containing protein n=1 Tax=Pisolithus orientalis TaxID=936130 RepID=UPI00222451B9|nr:Spc98 family-domain-containing protein [Pisolithus orientalis]KAI6034851.1 Spc98 family-domain-containing protein [Pisolithus orientalis]